MNRTKALAERHMVLLRCYDIIYNLENALVIFALSF
jgi:hypothetical protein